MYFCCDEHIELAIDSIVDEEEVAPVLEKLNCNEQFSTGCSFCEEEAKYKVSG